ncbi:MAG: DUF421 domain-containing protein [Thermoanaerobacterales bacterium]|nr:DUF421 domain-containing protein [Thermoanaerobacterales bacterium]
MTVTEIIFRTCLVYVVLLFVMRVMGKRQIGNLSPFDFVVAIIIAELAANPLEAPGEPLWRGLLPLAVLVLLEIGFSYLALRTELLRRLLSGVPQVVIKDGRLKIDEMRAARCNIDEILGQLRQEGFSDMRRVAHGVLETSGRLSVIPTGGADRVWFPYVLIADGQVQRANLAAAGLNGEWLQRHLDERGLCPAEVFLAMLNTDGTIWLQTKDNPRQEKGGKKAK